MKRTVLAALAAICVSVPAQAQNFSAEDLNNRLIHRRAVEAVIWGMSAVNYDLMLQQMLTKTKGEINQFIYWSRPADWKNQTLTPNPDAIYFMTFFNTKDVGPVVIEVPPAEGGSLAANIDDIWQAALEDAGPAGADEGKGGKYLVLPPDYSGQPPAGYFALPSQTYGGYALFRSNLPSRTDADFAKSVAYAKQLKIYPLASATNPPPTVFTDVMEILYDSTIPFDLRFFQSLDHIVQSEPWQERDRAMIDQLRSIGIEKGKPFNPDAKMQGILNAAAREAKAWLELRYESAIPPYFEGHLLARAGPAGGGRGAVDPLRKARRLRHRRARPHIHLRLHRHQTSGHRPVLLDGDQRQGRHEPQRRQHLSPDGAGERASQAVLVGDGIRPRNPRAHSRHAAGERRIAERGGQEKRRRHGRRLLRPESASWEGIKLGADQA
jgi:hypothetical protein